MQSFLWESYTQQKETWPKEGRHILAQFDTETIFVYQAYSPKIGKATAEKGTFAGGFSYSRMSWIKPNFLWMMYRSGWGTKENQQVTLALRIRRSFFESLLSQAVASTRNRDIYATEEDWSRAVATSDVRLQWDPDHHPSGAKQERRAIQLGLRGEVLAEFGKRQLLEVLDISELVEAQRLVLASKGTSELITPKESVYVPSDPTIAIGLNTGLAPCSYSSGLPTIFLTSCPTSLELPSHALHVFGFVFYSGSDLAEYAVGRTC